MIKLSNESRMLRLDFTEIFLWIFAVLVASQGVISPALMGIPLFSLFFLAFSLWIALFFVLQCRKKTSLFRDRWLFVLLIFVCSMMSVLNGWDMFSSFYNAFLYGTPFLLLALPSYRKIEIRTCITFVRVMVAIGALVSVAVFLGLIDSRIANHSMALNILVLDNSIGLIGMIASLYQILDNKNHYNKSVAAVYLALSYLIIIMGQSRARLILSLIITALFVLYGLTKKQKDKGKIIFFLVLFTVVAVVLVNNYYDLIMDYMSVSFDKFDTIFEDDSSTYRMDEIKSHFELLKEYPVTGIGCGALNHRFVTEFDEYFYGHCMLTSMWALNGIFAGTIMLAMLVATLIKSVTAFVKTRSLVAMMALILAGTIIFLSSTSAGFAKYSTHFMMLLLGCCLAEWKNESKNQSEA